ncbi:MAG TPA: glycoside hydrolase family 43 protein [Ktedonobacteraceae bacterium]|nr:glycoside hydrolase family 43 protein [Ktedonobacteraceae bacterium]
MFRPGEIWYDTEGNSIQAHGGGVLYQRGTYYWFGENRAIPAGAGERVNVVGVSCYSSSDFVHWQNEGLVLPAVQDDPSHDLHISKVVERPKVLYNAGSGLYVMWMHIDDSSYEYAHAGVAVSVSPTGPYTYLGSVRPGGIDSRDMTVFQDDDGSAYLIFSGDWNSILYVVRLSDDYLTIVGEPVKAIPSPGRNQGREAPAIFKREGRYFLITSGCTGWQPNAAEYAVAASPLGPWTTKGNPCLGPNADETFFAQSTFVLPVRDRDDAYIFMADRWRPEHLADSRYVWLPIQLSGDELRILWHENWDLDVFSQQA